MSKLSVAQVNAKIESHEAVCAERWLEIINRVKRVEHFIVVSVFKFSMGLAPVYIEDVFKNLACSVPDIQMNLS